MALTTIHNLYSIMSGSTVIHQLGDATLSRNVSEIMETPVGGTMPLFVAETGQRPEVSFSSHQLQTLITLLGPSGADTGIVKLLGRKVANKTGPVATGAGTDHASWTAAVSMGYLNSITASNRQRATASGTIKLLWNGSDATVVYSGSTAIAAFTAAAEQFVLGAIVIDGNVIEGTDGFSLNFNPMVAESDDDFQNDPPFAAVIKTEPVIEFTTTSPAIWSLNATAISTAVKINLVALSPSAQRVANATTSHILIEALDGQIRCESVGGSKLLTRVTIKPVSADNSTMPVTLTVSNAVELT